MEQLGPWLAGHNLDRGVASVIWRKNSASSRNHMWSGIGRWGPISTQGMVWREGLNLLMCLFRGYLLNTNYCPHCAGCWGQISGHSRKGARKEGSGGVGREAEGKQTIFLPSASLQSSERARLEILKEGRWPGRKRTGARNETSRGDLPLVPGSALRGSNISADQAT